MATQKTVLQIEALVSNLAKLNDAVSAASAKVSAAELADDFDKTSVAYKNLVASEKKAKNEAKVVQEEYNNIVGESGQTFKNLAENLRDFAFSVNENKNALAQFGIASKDLGRFFSQVTDKQSTLTTEIEQRKNEINETKNLSKQQRELLEQEIREREKQVKIYKGVGEKINNAVASISKIGMSGSTDIDLGARARQRADIESLAPIAASTGERDKRFTKVQEMLDAYDAAANLEDAIAKTNKTFQETVGVVDKVKSGITDFTDKIPVIGSYVSGFINDKFKDAVKLIEVDLQKSLEETEDGLEKSGLQARIFNLILKANPIFLIGGLLVGALLLFRNINKAARDLSNELGMGRDQLDGQLASLKMQELKFEAMGFEADKLKTTLTTLSTEFKDLELVTAENAANIEMFAQQSGIGGDEVAKLTKQLIVTQGVSFDMALDMQRQAAAMAKTAGIAKGRILSDMASNAEDFARFSMQGAEGLAQAAVAANQMGLNLTKVMKVAGELLDFESSITKEFEAQVLTGRALNLEAARQAALSGDQDSLMREIKSVAMGVNLETMNVVQKDAIASAIGLSVSDLMRVSRGESLDKMETQIDVQKKTNDILIAGFNDEGEKLDKIAAGMGQEARDNLYADMVDNNVGTG
jgi:hypothetical protein